MTVREILDLPPVRAAAPVLTTGREGLNRRVDWAHSSEIFEIGPLLAGGELLLTTGLGLSGADAGARRFWIRDLAERGVAAVAIEIGRSLSELPPELVDEADRCELPLIRLDHVVPFEQICRAVNTVVLDRESTELRLADRLSDHLLAALAAGGLSAVARVAAEQLGGSVLVSTAAGQVAAAGGVQSTQALSRAASRASARAPVYVDGVPWGEVLLGGRSAWPSKALDAAARRIAAAAAVAVVHLRGTPGESESVAAALLGDLLTGKVTSEHEFVVRAGLAGLHPPAGATVLGVAASTTDPVAAIALLRGSAESGRIPAGALAGRVRDQVLAVVVVDGDRPDPAGAMVARLREQSRMSVRELSCVVGPPVELADVHRSLDAAYTAVVDAGPGVHAWRNMLPDRLLGMLAEADRQHLVDDLLGPLRAWDASHGSDLIRTVDVYLRHGCSPTRAADILHVRRQSLHQRLRRAEELLGHPVDDPSVITAMLLATRAAGMGGGGR